MLTYCPGSYIVSRMARYYLAILKFTISVGGFKATHFSHNAKVLPLGRYDMVLGMDWLEKFRPMKCDWLQKRIEFDYQDKLIKWQDVLPQDLAQYKACEGCRYSGIWYLAWIDYSWCRYSTTLNLDCTDQVCFNLSGTKNPATETCVWSCYFSDP